MRMVLIADTFPPLRTSGAVQLRDLSREFVRQGHELTVLLPSADMDQAWQISVVDEVRVVRLKAPKTKEVGYARRTIGEFLMPFFMRRNLYKSPVGNECWDGVVWYSPSIFFGPLVSSLKKTSKCKSYLILRDIFPEWAVDMGLMGRGLPYLFFKAVACYQYSVADAIGVQSPGNLAYFNGVSNQTKRRIEVLQNWLEDAPVRGCSIKLAETILAGRKVFVYAGNMGVAQGMDILLDLAAGLRPRKDIGFLFVGRGRDAKRLADKAQSLGLSNVLFQDEIDPDEIPSLYAQCSVGLVALDPRHKSHNIPGKFLTYMQGGLPVLANINAGNDLAGIIRREKVGSVCENGDVRSLEELALSLIDSLAVDDCIEDRCRSLYLRLFSPLTAVSQIASLFEMRK